MARQYNYAREWIADNYEICFPNSDGGLTIFIGHKPYPNQFTSMHQYIIAMRIYVKRSCLLKAAYHADFNEQNNLYLRDK